MMHNAKSNEFDPVDEATAKLNPEVSLTVGEVVTMKALEYRVLSFGKKEVRLEILGRVPPRNHNETNEYERSRPFGGPDYYEAQPGVKVYGWSPEPPGTPNAKVTQVHLHFTTSMGTSAIRFKGPDSLDSVIDALLEHRERIWGRR